MITMILGGLWHGSSWNFVIWGAIHGIVLSIEKLKNSKLKVNNKFSFIGYPLTFLIIMFSWIFFRTQNLNDAFFAVKRIFEFKISFPFISDINAISHIILTLFIGIMFDSYLKIKKINLEDYSNNFNTYKLSVISSIIILLISLFYSNSNNFIYFQF